MARAFDNKLRVQTSNDVKYFLTDTGLHYSRSRFCDTNLERFTSQVPIGFRQGDFFVAKTVCFKV